MATRKAASVLPEPVGAAIRVWRPAWISGQRRACGSVGEPKRFSNQEATAGWKLASGMALLWRKTGGRSPGRITGTGGGGFLPAPLPRLLSRPRPPPEPHHAHRPPTVRERGTRLER